MDPTPEVNVEVITPAASEETVTDVIDTAIVIADKIDEARKEGEDSAEKINETMYTIHDVLSLVMVMDSRIGILTDLVMGLSDQIAALAQLEVAEIIETQSEETIDEIVETAEDIADVTPPAESVEIASEPQIRKVKKTKWL